jgi:hypothetical protein
MCACGPEDYPTDDKNVYGLWSFAGNFADVK